MPNLKQHLAISGVVSAGTYLAMCQYYGRKPDLGEFMICEAVGLVAGTVPDALEPAIHPNHRALCHSMALGGGLAKFALVNCCKENGDWEEFLKILAAVATVCYVTHLVADACTPKGLPLLHR
jgi:inner membrane protein